MTDKKMSISMWLIIQAFAATGYFISAVLGLWLSPSYYVGATFYPAAGFALAFVLHYRKNAILGLALGIFITNAIFQGLTNNYSFSAFLLTFLISLAILAQAGGGYFILRDQIILMHDRFYPDKVIIGRMVAAIAIPSLLGSLIIMLIYRWQTPDSGTMEIYTWLRWWVGDMLGVLLITPIVISLLGGFSNSKEDIKRIALPLLIFVLLISGLTYRVHRDLSQQIDRAVEQKLGQYGKALSAEIFRIEEQVRALALFYQSGFDIHYDDFLRFTENVEISETFVSGFSWNRLLQPEDVLAFEEKHKKSFDLEKFHVRNFDSEWDSPAKPDWLVVVEHIRPQSHQVQVSGLNIMSEQVRGETLLKAVADKETKVTPPINLIQSDTQTQWSVLIFQSVYFSSSLLSASTNELPDGFAVGVINVTNLMDTVFPADQHPNEEITLRDSADESGSFFYRFDITDQTLLSDATQTISIKIANRDWVISLTPSQNFAYQSTYHFDLWLAFLSLILGTVIVYFLISNSLTRLAIEQEVERKTGLLKNIDAIRNVYIEGHTLEQSASSWLGGLLNYSVAKGALLLRKATKDTDSESVAEKSVDQCQSELFNAFKDSCVDCGIFINPDLPIFYMPLEGFPDYMIFGFQWHTLYSRKAVMLLFEANTLNNAMENDFLTLRDSIVSVDQAISERTKGEEVFRKLEEKAALLEQTEFISHAGSWKYDYANHDLWLSSNAHNIIGHADKTGLLTLEDLYSQVVPNDMERLKNEISESFEAKLGIFETEHKLINRFTNNIHYLRELFQHQLDESENIISTIGIVYDVTDTIIAAQKIEAESQREQAQYEAIRDLTFNLLSVDHNLQEKLVSLVEKARNVLGVSRASIWLFNEDRTVLKCHVLLNEHGVLAEHHSDLIADMYPMYFELLRLNSRLSIEDAFSDPRVAELVENYLKPMDIRAMVDVPITQDGEINGVLCVEQLGEGRNWLTDETLFLSTLAVLTGQTLVAHERSTMFTLLEQQERDHAVILDNMVDGVVTINEHGTILTVNQATLHLFDYSLEELIGQNVSLLMPDSMQRQHDQYIQNYLETGENKITGVGRVLDAKSKCGKLFPIRLSVSEIVDSGEQSRIFVGVIHDMTNEKLQQEIIHRTMKMEALGKLTGGIAHDFNNILGVMLGYAEMLHEFLPETEVKLRNFTRQIEIAGERARTLIYKLRAFAKKDNDTQKVVDVNHLLREQRMILEKAITSKNKLTLKLEEKPAFTRIDESDFESGILNLCVNAMHAMPDGGSITICTIIKTLDAAKASPLGLVPGAHVMITVMDTGQGMSPDVQERIFEPFYTTKNDKGTGLGLSQLYGFMERSGGAIMVESEVNKGTVFSLYLPLSDSPESIIEPRNPAVSLKLSGEHAVLVVDDEIALQSLIKDRLTLAGYHVYTARNGQEALLILEQQAVDLVLTDVVMPEMDGVELANQISNQWPEMPILLMSGYSDEITTELTRKELLTQCLMKPFNLSDLLNRIQTLLTF